MVIFFAGMGVSALVIALCANKWQIGAALTLMGAFASIYHPVGIPMLVQKAKNPGFTIGVNGLAGNMGIALAAILTAAVRPSLPHAPLFHVTAHQPGAGKSYLCELIAQAQAEGSFEGLAINDALSLINQMVLPYTMADVLTYMDERLSEQKLGRIVDTLFAGLSAQEGGARGLKGLRAA